MLDPMVGVSYGSDMTTTTTTRTSRVPDAHASQGGVRQHGGTLPVYVCNTCYAEVVWVTSARTGRKYLANVTTNYNGARYYRGDNVHPRDCADLVAAAADKAKAEREERLARAARVLNRSIAQSRRLHLDGVITEEQLLKDLAMYEAEYAEDVAER